MPGVQAAYVTADAVVADPDCYWSDGPGTELYVPSGKTCTIDANTTAQNVSGWTNYAVIVYAGGTLEIVAASANTNLTIDGDIYIMGTVNIGDGVSSSFNNTITTTNASGSGDIYIRLSGILNVTNNAGSGENYFTAIHDVYVGEAGDGSNAQLNINGSTANTIDEILESYDDVNINAGELNVNSLKVKRPSSPHLSTLDIASGAYLTVNDYHACTYPDSSAGTCAMEVGYDYGSSQAGSAIVTVAGTLTVGAGSAVDRSIFIGNTGYNGKLAITSTGVMSVTETTASFGGPGPLDDPSNYFGVFSDGTNGLEVAGLLQTGMFLWNNGGTINVTSAGSTGDLDAQQSYKQASSLYIDTIDSMTITGMAEIDGDATIAGALNVTACTKITNGSTESFDVTPTGTFNTNTGGTGCTLTNTSSNDGLNVQGADTDFTIANGSGGIGDQTVFVTYGDFRTDDGAIVDANGYFTAEDDMIVEGGSLVSMQDTDSGDNFEADNLNVEPASGGASSALTVDAGSVFDLIVGQVDIGTVTSTETGGVTVHGTLNIPTSSTYNFNVADYGQLVIEAGGTVNADAASGLFLIDGGTVVVRGASGNEGTLNIADQELQMNDNVTTAYLTIGDATYAYGVLTSLATPASALGFDYDSGVLDIQYHGEATFDDQIDIDTTGNMYIGGFLEGINNIFVGCTGTTCKVEPSGEMKVVTGTGTPTIKIEQDLDLLGKLNGDDGAGDVHIDDTVGAEINSNGLTSEDSYFYIIANDLTIDAAAAIDVSGFNRCISPGGTPTYGGSYGGEGAGGNTQTFGAAKYTTAPNYATSSENPIGMCGYDGSGNKAANPGGAVYIEVYNDININGPIKANGESNSDNSEGAGSGGLIVINHMITHSDTGADFTGFANIEAVGGNGDGATSSYGGGGGRIIIDSILFEQPDDDEAAEPHYKYTGGVYTIGGESNNGAGDYAAAGTIVYLGDDNNPNGTLIVDQGNRSLGSSGKVTNITTTGDYVFDRVQVLEGAALTYDSTPLTMPVSCFKDGTSSYSLGATCALTHDKPDTLHVNDTYAGAQSGDEPWWSVPVVVGDRTPEFSMKYRNPEDASQEGQYVVIEVDDSSDFSSPLWSATDANNPVQIASTGEGSRTEDIEYGGAALTGGTTYYVRAAFSNSDGSVKGLWTHRDMDNHYQFELDSSYMEIDNDCSDVITVETGTATPLKYSPGKMYGSGTCTFTLTSTDTTWKLYYSRISDGAILNDGTGTYIWDPIDNAGADCTVDNTGNTDDEEYGFNISGLTGFGTATVQTDSECSSLYSSTDVFDIETLTNKNLIIDGSGTTITGATLDLVIHANIDINTVPETYELDTIMILSDTP